MRKIIPLTILIVIIVICILTYILKTNPLYNYEESDFTNYFYYKNSTDTVPSYKCDSSNMKVSFKKSGRTYTLTVNGVETKYKLVEYTYDQLVNYKRYNREITEDGFLEERAVVSNNGRNYILQTESSYGLITVVLSKDNSDFSEENDGYEVYLFDK